MLLLPDNKTLTAWIPRVPDQGDLVFCRTVRDRELLKSLSVPVFTLHEMREQSADLMGLDARSWYGYVMGDAIYCARLGAGYLESLEPSLLKQIFASQLQLKVPTILRKSTQLGGAADKALRFGHYIWITSGAWAKSSRREKTLLLAEYFRQNPRVEKSPLIKVKALETSVQKSLQYFKVEKWVNTFADRSGPNCFAAVALGVTGGDTSKGLSSLWLHWNPLHRFLQEQGYKKIPRGKPQAQDVVIFFEGKTAVHGGLCLGEDFIFEKAGQDFYEPYLVTHLAKVKSHWKDTQMQIWRRQF